MKFSGLETDDSVAEYCGQESYGRGGEANPLEKSYKPKILRHYPDITSWYVKVTFLHLP